MQLIIIKTHKLLIKHKNTVAVAESCTAGLLSYLLTQLPGSSRYFLLGITTYSNTSKGKLLRIPASVIASHGAVSKVVAVRMSESIKHIAHADFGIAITGIAGPTGGSPGKPVGTVYIAVASRDNTLCKRFIFNGSRFRIRNQAALKALEMLVALIPHN